MRNHWINVHETKNLRLWNIDDGEQWWYSSATKKEALEMHMEEMLEGGIEEEEMLIYEVSPDTMVSVRNEDGTNTKKTASEWASDGKRLVASTAFY